MIARIPELSRPEPSPSPKPRRLSISFWLRTRGGSAPSGASPSPAIAAHSSASLASSSVAWSAILSPTPVCCERGVPLSLDEHFLEQDVDDLGRRGGRGDTQQELLAQPIHP